MSIGIQDLLLVNHVSEYNLGLLGRKSFSGVSTDSRTVRPGDLFFAIRGESYDGHKFVTRAFEQGALCVIVDARADRRTFLARPHIVVRDTVRALGTLARIYRNKFDIPVIAVAGSNGKTTTKEMITSVLSTEQSVLSTHGNLNNHIGVPRTLFGLNKTHTMAVVEIGTNHFGELTNLCEILAPTHGVITNVGREHLEFFHDIAGVAKAEGELFAALGKSGTGFVNNDDSRVVAQAKQLRKKITYGFSTGSRIRGLSWSVGQDGCATFSLKARGEKAFEVGLSIPGRHAVSNALAAAAIGLSFDVSPKNIRSALRRFTAVGKRMETFRAGGVTILNDTYNANPDSVLAALETLRAMNSRGKKLLILADMLELGRGARIEHENIGRQIGTMGFQYLLTYGRRARHLHDRAHVPLKLHFEHKNDLSKCAAGFLKPGDSVLVKGSRGMKMEDVVTYLKKRLEKKAS